MSLNAPYLQAVQDLPGDTPGEKYRWIVDQIRKQLLNTNDLEEIVEYEKFPRALAPLIQIEAVRLQMKAIKRGRAKESKRDLCNYGAIAEALKSEDEEVVNKALQIPEFFDGSNSTVTNVTFFFDELFPIVSLKTRLKVVKALACHLRKKPTLAEQFFGKMLSIYGMEQALPLLPACSEAFIFDVILQRKLALPRRIVKLMYAKDPDLVVRYLRLFDRNNERIRNASIFDYSDFFAKLVKKRLQAFAEIYEMHEEHPVPLKLSKSSAEAFWRNGKEYLERKPRLYIKLLPLKMVDKELMEKIFPSLLPDKLQDFSTDNALQYLQFYPEEKRSILVGEAYKKVYGKDLLEDTKNLTPPLMMLLSEEERVKQARRMLVEGKGTYPMNYSFIWRCYLPTSEAIGEIKAEIARTPEMEDRAALLCQMVYSCKVNRDDASLLQVLKYWRDRHKNEQSWFTFRVIQCLLKEYKLADWGESLWSVLFDVVKRMYVKNELSAMHVTTTEILEEALRYRLKNNLAIEPVIDIFVETKIKGYRRMWNVLDENPDYERKCLEACLAVVERNRNSQKDPWKSEKHDILRSSVESIYLYNTKHCTKDSKVEPLSIKDYPWLLKEIELMLDDKSNVDTYTINSLKRLFATHEKELHNRYWSPKEAEIEGVESGAALALLRKDPNRILLKWDKYLDECRRSYYTKRVQRFIRATRWYKEIPFKLAEQCVKDIKEEKCPNSLNILALLLHGHTFTKFVEPLIPAEENIDINHENAKTDFLLAHSIITSTKSSNPPVPLELVGRMCSTDYLSYALMALNNLCRRTSLPKVISFAKTLSSKRVSVRKHGIRVMHMVATLQQISEFLLNLWKLEEHYSIRQVIFAKASDIFRKEPSSVSWSVLEQIISKLELKDISLMGDLLGLVRQAPEEYIERIMKLVFAAIDRLAEQGLSSDEVIRHTSALINIINSRMCKLLPEEFMEDLLNRFLFHQEDQIANAARSFVVHHYLHCEGEKLEKRVKVVTEILKKMVKSHWNLPCPKKPRYFPVNYAVHELIVALVHSRNYKESDRKIIEAFLEAFNSVLTPQMDSMSYLLLIFASERSQATKPKEFGARIAGVLAKLLETFTPYFMGCLSDTLEYYLDYAGFGDVESAEVKVSMMEGFFEAGTIEAHFLCAKMLTPVSARYFDRHDTIVMNLAKSEHPAIKSILYNYINRMDASKF